ncbi:1-acyl-sn-glycerol-3-phosphate acyltransferase [Jannaschia sp. Os4]|uniref:lysophospholipid acyltransferase family protein n=1 Tax=Jannaschia sp. Os4 TaxID=2807617 RepID=UPI00193A42A8|nr:lysophospholipid acyltransferase family protein [Jannaschia sp. Os4]MBM2576604.1 1-acyl-sn-glycerol-3-phosphate acyltransferase [Jannaschia sp. Os4]
MAERDPTWAGHPDAPPPRAGAGGWARAVRRGLPLAATTFGGLLVLLLVRQVERPLHGLHRPWTPRITQWVCRMAFRWMGLPREVRGRMMDHEGIVVANHSSWLDIFALNASKRIYFVSKAEVAGWPGIGWLARATGTLFIVRDPRQARAQQALFEARLHAGHKLLFFPEGTSTDGVRVLPFKPTLFASLFADGLRETSWVQPVSVAYHPPPGADARFYGWWGGMGFGDALLRVLSARRQGRVVVTYHAPLRVAEFAGRKDLARAAEAAVRAGLEAEGRLLA